MKEESYKIQIKGSLYKTKFKIGDKVKIVTQKIDAELDEEIYTINGIEETLTDIHQFIHWKIDDWSSIMEHCLIHTTEINKEI